LETHLPWVDVVYEDVENMLPNSLRAAEWIEATKTKCLFHVAESCRILVSDANRISIDIPSIDKLPSIRPFMTTCGFATLAMQNLNLPLHVGAVETPYGIWLLAGQSGAGKSTLSFALAKKMGWNLLGDDLAVLQPTQNGALTFGKDLHFGVNKIKMWADAVDGLAIEKTALAADFFRPTKFHVPVDVSSTSMDLKKVSAILHLVWDNEGLGTAVRPMTRAASFEVLMNAVYPARLAHMYQDLPRIRTTLLSLATQLGAFQVSRSQTPGSLDAVIDQIAKLEICA
jgi:hypothetical protein